MVSHRPQGLATWNITATTLYSKHINCKRSPLGLRQAEKKGWNTRGKESKCVYIDSLRHLPYLVVLQTPTGWTVEARIQEKARGFLFSKTVQISSQVHPVTYTMRARFFPKQKRKEPEGDLSHPCSAKVKNEWNYVSTPPVSLHGVEGDSCNFLHL